MHNPKKILSVLIVVYFIFVIFGSLFPLEFESLSSSEAWDRFVNIQYQDLASTSRTDFAANILLFIPLAYLLLGLIWHKRNVFFNFVSSLLVIIICIGLCSTIEYTQVYFRQRTVALSDIIAESLGALIGVALFWLTGEKFLDWISSFSQIQTQSNRALKIVQTYIFILFLYNVMPLDLILSPVELYHKWHEGKIILVPFSFEFDSLDNLLISLVMDILIWIPVPYLILLSDPNNKLKAFVWTVLSALIIEFCQLFVFSRITDTTDIITALLGAGIGLLISTKFTRAPKQNPSSKYGFSEIPEQIKLPIAVISFAIWSLILLAIFWYPYDFNLERLNMNDVELLLFRIPFSTYFFATEYRAITEFFHKFISFVPLGICIAFVDSNKSKLYFFKPLGFFNILSLGIFIELGQVTLVNKYPNNSDIIIELLGGIFGYLLYNFICETPKRVEYAHQINSAKPLSLKPESVKKFSNGNDMNRINKNIKENNSYNKIVGLSISELISGIIILTIGFYYLGQLSFVPYNLRELLSGQNAILTCGLLSILVFWFFGLPVWFFNPKILRKANPISFLRIVFLHILISALLIQIAAPLEAIYDIVGSPVLSIPSDIELFLRLVALFTVFSLMLFCAVMISNTLIELNKILLQYYIFCVILIFILFPVCYWGIVMEAATDNITELLPDDGYSWAVLLIPIYCLLFFSLGATVSAFLGARNYFNMKLGWLIMVALLGSFPLGNWLILNGTESHIFKYDKVFSALQFLLSSSREHYEDTEKLKIRFYILHFGLVLITCISQLPMWKSYRL